MRDKHIFIDTGAYIARFHKKDRQHHKSCEVWQWIKDENLTAFTTNHVIDELATLLARRTSYDFASEKLQEIYDSEFPVIIRPDKDDEKKALKLFSKYSDQKVSFTDCLSFAVMNQLKINQVFSFDGHFAILGFKVIPSFYYEL